MLVLFRNRISALGRISAKNFGSVCSLVVGGWVVMGGWLRAVLSWTKVQLDRIKIWKIYRTSNILYKNYMYMNIVFVFYQQREREKFKYFFYILLCVYKYVSTVSWISTSLKQPPANIAMTGKVSPWEVFVFTTSTRRRRGVRVKSKKMWRRRQ